MRSLTSLRPPRSTSARTTRNDLTTSNKHEVSGFILRRLNNLSYYLLYAYIQIYIKY
jgi:hypothetical protein